MNRRSFLKGTFGGVTAAGLVIAGADTDLSAFASSMKVGEPMVGAGEVVDSPAPELGTILFNSEGQPVCVVESYRYSVNEIDATPMGSSVRVMMPGTREIRLTAVVMGRVAIKFEPGRAHELKRW